MYKNHATYKLSSQFSITVTALQCSWPWSSCIVSQVPNHFVFFFFVFGCCYINRTIPKMFFVLFKLWLLPVKALIAKKKMFVFQKELSISFICLCCQNEMFFVYSFSFLFSIVGSMDLCLDTFLCSINSKFSFGFLITQVDLYPIEKNCSNLMLLSIWSKVYEPWFLFQDLLFTE